MPLMLFLLEMSTSIDASIYDQREKFIRLISDLTQNQNCHVDVMASNGDLTPFLMELAAKTPVTLKSSDLSIEYSFNTCVLHVVFLTKEEDVFLIDYNLKERLCFHSTNYF